MSLRSSNPPPAEHRWLAFGAAACLAGVGVVASCSAEVPPVEDRVTGIDFEGPDGGGNVCPDSAVAANTLVLDLYRAPTASGPGPESCRPCITDGKCTLVERQCRCVPGTHPLPPLSVALHDVLGGVRFENVDPDTSYCLRLIALRLFPPPAGDTETCQCEADWLSTSCLASASQFCGMTREYVQPNGASVTLGAWNCRPAGGLDDGLSDCVGVLPGPAPPTPQGCGEMPDGGPD